MVTSMPNGRSGFEVDTAETLKRCAKWLERHSDELAASFAEGCRSWSVEFSAGVDGMFDHADIRVGVSKADRDVIRPYFIRPYQMGYIDRMD